MPVKPLVSPAVTSRPSIFFLPSSRTPTGPGALKNASLYASEISLFYHIHETYFWSSVYYVFPLPNADFVAVGGATVARRGTPHETRTGGAGHAFLRVLN